MTLTSFEVESEEDEVFSKPSRSNLITFIQDLTSRCQEKAIHMKVLTKQCDLLKEELRFVQNKNEALDHTSRCEKETHDHNFF